MHILPPWCFQVVSAEPHGQRTFLQHRTAGQHRLLRPVSGHSAEQTGQVRPDRDSSVSVMISLTLVRLIKTGRNEDKFNIDCRLTVSLSSRQSAVFVL